MIHLLWNATEAAAAVAPSPARPYAAAPKSGGESVRNDSPILRRYAALLLLGLLAWFAFTAVLRPLVRPYNYSDFATFFSAALAFRDHGNPYELQALQRTGQDDFSGWIGGYLYPPPFAAVVIRPLAALPFPVARRLWVIIETLAYLAALVLLAAIVFGTIDRRSLLLTGLIGLTWAPFQLDLRLGSVSGVLLLLLASALWFLRKQQEGRAGMLLGLAALLKISPALVIGLLALRGHGRLALAAFLAAAAAVFLSLPATGWQAWSDFFTQVIPQLSSGNFSWFTNQSLDALFWRLFMVTPDTTPWLHSTWLYRFLSIGTSVVVVATVAWWAWRGRRTSRPASDATLWLSCLGLLAALLAARVTWEYMTVLAIPCFLLWLQRLLTTHATRHQWIVFAAAWSLCAAPFPYSKEPLREGLGLLLMSPRLYGMLLAFVAILHALRKDRRLTIEGA